MSAIPSDPRFASVLDLGPCLAVAEYDPGHGIIRGLLGISMLALFIGLGCWAGPLTSWWMGGFLIASGVGLFVPHLWETLVLDRSWTINGRSMGPAVAVFALGYAHADVRGVVTARWEDISTITWFRRGKVGTVTFAIPKARDGRHLREVSTAMIGGKAVQAHLPRRLTR